jgi:hypothetical protein
MHRSKQHLYSITSSARVAHTKGGGSGLPFDIYRLFCAA